MHNLTNRFAANIFCSQVISPLTFSHKATVCYWQPLGELEITKHLETTNSRQKQKSHRNNSFKGKEQMCCPRPDSRKVNVTEVWRALAAFLWESEPRALWAHVFTACSSERAQGSRRPWRACHASAWLAQTASFKTLWLHCWGMNFTRVHQSLNWSSATKYELTSHEREPASRERERKALAPQAKAVFAKLQQNQVREILCVWPSWNVTECLKYVLLHFILALVRVCGKPEIYLFGNSSSNKTLFFRKCFS